MCTIMMNLMLHSSILTEKYYERHQVMNKSVLKVFHRSFRSRDAFCAKRVELYRANCTQVIDTILYMLLKAYYPRYTLKRFLKNSL